MARGWKAWLVPFILLPAVSAQAGNNTYCVGGYEGMYPSVVAACNQPAVRRQHRKWHFHSVVSDGARCFICYDEQDDTCDIDFLVNTPRFHRVANPYSCDDPHSADELIAHVIAGKVVDGPPASPVQLEAKVERLTPGPYTAGDRISVTGAVRDEGGGIRKLAGGSFRVTDSAGQAIDYPGRVQPDGTVVGDFTLPPSGSVKVEFLPAPPPLAKHETLRAAASAPWDLKVELCGLRARVVSPSEGEPLLSGQSVSLRAVLLEANGQVPLASPPPAVQLSFTVQVDGEAAVTVPADASLAASWMPPASSSPRAVSLSASGRAGDRIVCPAGEVHATASDVGLGFDTSGLPATCYVGLPCRGTVRLLRPPPGPARQRVDELLADTATQVSSVHLGQVLASGPPRADDAYEIAAVYEEVKNASWSLEIHTPRGDFAMPAHEVRVRLPLKLVLPAELDFGTLAAGTEVLRTCRKLDFGQSQAAEEHRWEMVAEGLAGCTSRPVLAYRNAAGQPDLRPFVPKLVVEALDPRDRRLDVCLELPACAGDRAPDGAVLRVVPLTPEFASNAVAVRLRWQVKGRGFLGCHAPWLAPLAGGLLVVVVLLGLVRPARFPPAAAIRVAGSERGIRQASAILLRDCPGSGAGFFRDARLGLHGDGSLNGRTRGALASLHATRTDGVLLRSAGLVEIQDRRTLKWEPVAAQGRGCMPVPGALYRAGGNYFKVDPG